MKNAIEKYVFILAISQITDVMVLLVLKLVLRAILDSSRVVTRMGLEDLTTLMFAVTLENGKMANKMEWELKPTLTAPYLKVCLLKVNS
jgi:ABC-type uncharacterized transport system permease subunit